MKQEKSNERVSENQGMKSKCISRDTFTQRGAQNCGYNTNILTQGSYQIFEGYKLVQNFEILKFCI